MPTLIKLACPNCGYNLAEENLHSNILQCPRCNSYSYYESGMYNVNVFFGLLKCSTYQLNGLRRAIIDRYVSLGSLKAIRKIKYLHAERVLIPVREIEHEGCLKAISLLAESQETLNENTDIRLLLKDRSDIDKLFSMQYLQPLRLSVLRTEKVRGGYDTHTTILPVGRTKRAVDMAYQIEPKSLLCILYIPVYRLSFNDRDKGMICFANNELTGLPVPEVISNTGVDIDEIFHIAVAVGIMLAIATEVIIFATGNVTVEGHGLVGNVFMYVLGVILLSIILAVLYMAASVVTLFFFSMLSVSLNVIGSVKRWIIRRTLTRKFRLNEKSK